MRLPGREGGTDDYRGEAERLRVLDHNQEAIARKWDGGHRLLVGPSGSGKTLVLVHKAAFLLKYDPRVTSVLFVCYNITLVRYIRRLLASLGIPLGEGRGSGALLRALRAHPGRARGIRGRERRLLRHRGAGGARGRRCRKRATAPRYDAVLVDEGQDLSDDMVRVIVALLGPEADNLTIALDECQDIYRRRRASWQELGVRARGRVMPLRAAYRNSREITTLAQRFA